jgi:hypothetical protein
VATETPTSPPDPAAAPDAAEVATGTAAATGAATSTDATRTAGSTGSTGAASDGGATPTGEAPSDSRGADIGEAPSDSRGADIGEAPSDSRGADIGEAPSDSRGGDMGEAPSDSRGGDMGEAPSDSRGADIGAGARISQPTIALAVACVAGLAALVAVVVNARRGAVAERISNPAVDGAPRPVEALWGRTNWITLHQTGTVVMMIALITVMIVGWRRHPRHPILLMVVVTTLLIWQDPIMNWAPYAVYNPELWHWPETWPLVSLSPTVEPFIVIGYATFQMGPFFPAVWVLRRLQARRPPESFVSRHPLVSLAVLIFCFGFVIDALLETFLVRTQLYIYSQVIPFGSYAAGEYYQFPLIWESTLVTLVMIAAGVLLYRDDTGRTQAEKLAQRVRAFRGRPALGTFAVMFAIVNVTYFCYGAGFALIRATKTATAVACPWPYPEAKVYDPNGFYEEAGQPGPFFPGNWAGWPSAQIDGRPDVDPPAGGGGGRCGDGGVTGETVEVGATGEAGRTTGTEEP